VLALFYIQKPREKLGVFDYSNLEVCLYIGAD